MNKLPSYVTNNYGHGFITTCYFKKNIRKPPALIDLKKTLEKQSIFFVWPKNASRLQVGSKSLLKKI